jgi:hypothetical protein
VIHRLKMVAEFHLRYFTFKLVRSTPLFSKCSLFSAAGGCWNFRLAEVYCINYTLDEEAMADIGAVMREVDLIEPNPGISEIKGRENAIRQSLSVE